MTNDAVIVLGKQDSEATVTAGNASGQNDGAAACLVTALLAASGSAWSVSVYILAMAVLTFVSVFTIRESFRRDLHQTSGGSEEKVVMA